VIGQVTRSDNEVIDAAVILSESHFSAHYKRIRKELIVDIFTCGKEGDPNIGYDFLKREICAQEMQRVEVKR
jgi:S-adenosylmethionine/arginine decarboxylase-like enzyme